MRTFAWPRWSSPSPPDCAGSWGRRRPPTPAPAVFRDGTFRPLDGVKRQQMANFLYNLDAGPGVDLD